SSNGSISLKGSVSSPTDVVWSSYGTGSFLPDNTALQPIYKLSDADIIKGNFYIKLATKPVDGCANVSDSIKVTIANILGKNPSIVTRGVSKRRDNEGANYINFQVIFPENTKGELEILRKSPEDNEFVSIGTAKVKERQFIDNNLPDHDGSYEYVITGKNTCDEVIKSVPHKTMKLSFQPTEIDTVFNLTWEAYTNWPLGVESYEVYIDKRGQGSTLYEKVSGSVTQVSFVGTRSETPPCFVVKAKEKASNPQESWSNINCVEFPKKRLDVSMIPNAISPNNDGKNDVWDIANIEMYDNEVTIFNQWENKVYYKRGYTNDFNGENLPDGQYYYIIKYDDSQETGTLLITR
ncbi:MAG TPA: gliding motility-associated C-terminal domain-containing protein, partial [Cytophagaceae bacterium]